MIEITLTALTLWALLTLGIRVLWDNVDPHSYAGMFLAFSWLLCSVVSATSFIWWVWS